MSNQPTQARWSDEAFRRFWHTMSEIYGASWFRENGERPNTEWQRGLSDLTYQRAHAAIGECREAGHDRPPNLSQFLRLAKGLRLNNGDETQAKRIAQRTPTPNKEYKAAVHATAQEFGATLTARTRRAVFMPGEGLSEYMSALSEAMAKGKSEAQFICDRLEANGWTMQAEARFVEQLRMLGMVGFMPSKAIQDETQRRLANAKQT